MYSAGDAWRGLLLGCFFLLVAFVMHRFGSPTRVFASAVRAVVPSKYSLDEQNGIRRSVTRAQVVAALFVGTIFVVANLGWLLWLLVNR